MWDELEQRRKNEGSVVGDGDNEAWRREQIQHAKWRQWFMAGGRGSRVVLAMKRRVHDPDPAGQEVGCNLKETGQRTSRSSNDTCRNEPSYKDRFPASAHAHFPQT